MKIDLNKFRELSEYINEQKHPEFPLLLWNYSERAQYDNVWTEEIMMARGLITDLEGNIVARPFKKFFNVEQRPETMLEELVKRGKPRMEEKLDGSLGIIFFYDGLPHVSTRGSFVSEQAKWATQWLRKSELWRYMNPAYTYVTEIIYKENRIVVDYGNTEMLYLLAVINNETGEELDVKEEGRRIGFYTPRRYEHDLTQALELCKTLDGNEEGFVVVWPDNFRVKIKGEEYTRLHRLITGFSNKSIWELLMNHQPFDEFLERIPDEFYQYVQTTIADLKFNYNSIYRVATAAHGEVKELPTRKEQAMEVLSRFKDISDLVFGLLDGKNIEPMIWKRLRPKFAKPFHKDIDNG